MNASLPDGQPLACAGQPVWAGGKSGLHRATCRLTAGGARSKRVLRKVPQKTYRRAGNCQVRVKRCGKSAPRPQQCGWQGKPHVEQDQIGEQERPAPLGLPGRSLEPGRDPRPRRMAATSLARAGYRNRLIVRQALFNPPRAQLPVSKRHEQIGHPTLADGILDRLVHNAHRIEMRGDSMRKNRGKPNAWRL